MLQRRFADGSSRGLKVAVLALAAVVLLLSAANSAHAQASQLTVTIDGFAAQDWAHGQAVVTVLDGDGHPVAGLTQQDIHAQVNGSDVPITKISRAVDSDLPIAIVLAFDVSDSMRGAALDQARVAAHQFIDELGPKDSLAIIAFNNTSNLVQPFSLDRTRAHGTIDFLGVGGAAALYEATTNSILQAASSAQTGRRAIVLLSAASEAGHAEVRQQSLVAAKGLGVPVFVIGLGDGIDRDYLQQLGQAAGGRFYETPSPEGLGQLYQNVSDLIRDQYVVALDASALGLNTSDATTLHVSVTSGDASGEGERVVCPAKVCASFHGLQPGAQLKQTQTLVADVVSSEKVASVSLLVDGKSVQSVNDAPYQFSIDPKAFKPGDHTLALSVKTSGGSAQLGALSVHLGQKAGGFNAMVLLIGAILLVGVVALFALFVVLRRRRGEGDSPQPVPPPAPEPRAPETISTSKRRRGLLAHDHDAAPPSPVDTEPALGYLHATSGPLAGQTFAVGTTPVSVGSGHRCSIRLPHEIDGNEIASEHFRVWIRGNQLMVHEIRRLTAMGSVGGQWGMLSENDSFEIGSCVFKFLLHEVAVAAPEPVPNVLRDKPLPSLATALNGSRSEPEVAPAVLPLAAAPSEPAPNILRDRNDDQRPDEPQSEPVAPPNIFRVRTDDEGADEPPSEQAAGG